MGGFDLLLSAFAVLVVGALATSTRALDWKRAGYVAVVFVAAATALVWILAANVFLHGEAGAPRPLVALHNLGAALNFHVDALSALFLVIIPLVCLCAALYSVDYMRMYARENPGRYWPLFLLLLASMIGVVCTTDMLFFFVFWEMMALTSYLLVAFDRESLDRVRAAIRYFVWTHIGTACMFIAAIVLYSQTGGFAFADMKEGLAGLLATRPWLAHTVLGLFFIGFATKAGGFPLGGWLPDAYAAAPGAASAAFAGTMTKLGVYGVVRVFCTFLPPGDATTAWGTAIATLGAVSIFVGTISALRQDDCKKLLSFHIIGQVGYMLLAGGIGIAFLASNPTLSAIALIACLYHLLNNATYKSLLFLNAGAAEYATGTRDLNKMGGLAAYMPLTAGAALVASMSIAGIPPFSGFASKWMIYHVSFRAGMSGPPGGGWMTLFLALGLVAMFVSLVTLASFLKLLGGMFLGQVETNGRSLKGEVPVLMRLPQVVLAAICVLFGVVPFIPIAMLYPASLAAIAPRAMPQMAALFGASPDRLVLTFGSGHTVGLWSPALAIVTFAIACVIAYFTFRLGLAPSRKVEGWYCGEQFEPNLVRFRVHGFVGPFKQAFAKVYPTIPVPRVGVPRVLQRTFDLDSWFYGPLIRAGGRLTERFSHTHVGIPQMYMLWQVVGVILVVTILFLTIR